MPIIVERSLEFSFPNDWEASKFDDWHFYKGQFARVGDAEIRCKQKGCGCAVQCMVCGTRRVAGTKGIDILAVDPGSVCWHIEVKDYRTTRTSDFRFLADIVALKVRDTLACLVAARLNASEEQERNRATLALGCQQLRIVLHLEMPLPRSPLFSPSTQRANVRNRMQQLVKAVDVRPLVVSMTAMEGLSWSVRDR